MTQCSKAWKTLVHNRVRDTIYRLYRSSSLNLVATKEARNLYPAPSEMRPADVLVQLPEGPVAYDVTICDPTADTYLQLGSNKQPLKAAAEATRKKNSKHDAEVAKAGPQGLPTPFEFQPLAFETTGAMGRETEKWWKSVVAMEAELRAVGQPSSRRDLGLEHTWAANSFSSYWRQCIAMTLARAQAEAIVSCIKQSCGSHPESTDSVYDECTV